MPGVLKNSSQSDSGSDDEDNPNSLPLANEAQPAKVLNKYQEDVISKLVIYQEEFGSISEYDLEKITEFPLGDSEEDRSKRFQHIVEITLLNIQLIVEFSKNVPGFDTLDRKDQITLIQGYSYESLMLRIARTYDPKTDTIKFGHNPPYTEEDYRSGCLEDDSDSIFHYSRNMCRLKVDNAEYALLTAINMFTDRPRLLEPNKVEKIKEFYIETLRAYLVTNRPTRKNRFARLFSTLTELQTLGQMHREFRFLFKETIDR